ncbi:MAG: glycosyltransferase [Gemmatimonadota bacterium]
MARTREARRSAPLLSILLPCRDGARFLPECIRSLERQTEARFEVLAVEDGSRDGTSGLLRRWAERDERVRVLDSGGAGLVAALNMAAEHASAPLLARMDADDVARPDRLEMQVRYLRDHPRVAGCGAGVRYFPRQALGSGYRRYERWLNALGSPAVVSRDLFVECPVAHPALVLRRSAYRAVGGYRDPGWPEDYDLILRLHRAGYRLANLEPVLLDWRVHPDRLSMRSERYRPEAFQRCKAHHLSRGFLPPERPLIIWGAGRVGKGLARALRERGAGPVAFVDLDPRKIGQVVHGARVLAPDGLAGRLERARAPEDRPYLLVAVGTPGARDEVRRALDDLGLREVADYRAAA